MEIIDMHRGYFPSGPAGCSICLKNDARTLSGIVDYAIRLKTAGRPLIAICGACAHEVANLYTYSHSGVAEFDLDNEWPSSRRTGSKAPQGVSQGLRTRIMERDGFACQDCGAQVNLGVRRILSPGEGGAPRDPLNLLTLCSICGPKGRGKPHRALFEERIKIAKANTENYHVG